MDELRLKSILKDLDGINPPKNNFNPYMGAPQQFKEDHMSVKNGLISELKKNRYKNFSKCRYYSCYCSIVLLF